jgi:serine/threonine-protein kinase
MTIDHPGIITIADVSEHDGEHYIVSEYVKGETLDKIAVEEPIRTTRFFKLSLKIIEALAFAHEKMIVHGNLKPSNIIVTKDDEIKILDFGLNPRGEQVVKRIEADAIRYMAPEQIEGHDPNFASDLYALGGIFHCVLTGDAPFVSPITEELMTVIRHQPIDAAQMIEEGISSELILVVKRLLSKSPVDRFVNIAELKTTMQAIHELNLEERPLDRVSSEKTSPKQYILVSIIIALLIVIWSLVVSIMK